MHKEVILRAFNKAKEEEITETGIVPSTNKCAARLSLIIEEENTNFTYHKKSLYKLYKMALIESDDDIGIKQPQVVHTLCVYLGFENYEDFVLLTKSKRSSEGDDEGGFPIQIESKSNENGSETSSAFTNNTLNSSGGSGGKTIAVNLKMKVFISVGIVAILAIVIITGVNKQKWMVWEGTHYVEANFDATKVQNGTLKLYKEDRIENFRRIEPDSTYTFFNKNGSVRLWYGKNSQGDLEYFTDLGLHPETGKTLKPITQYMINKYIRKLIK